MPRTAFVTGGTGFVGINLIELLIERGWHVTALHRPSSDLSYLKRFPAVCLAEGSLADRDSLENAIPDGTEVVFHVAGDISFWSRNDARQDATNIDGTRNVVEAAATKGVGTLIHTSSIAAWGRVSGDVDEQKPLEGAKSWINYERSKFLGEIEALKGIEQGMKVVVVNPGDIFGRYDVHGWGRIFFLLKDNKLPAMGPGFIAAAHVRDVVEAHVTAVDKGRSGERYLVTGERHRLVDVAKAMAALTGSKVPRVAPAWLLQIYGWLLVAIAAITCSGKAPDVTPELAAIASEMHITYSNEKAEAELDYRPKSMVDAVRDNYDWLVNEGLLPKPQASSQ